MAGLSGQSNMRTEDDGEGSRGGGGRSRGGWWVNGRYRSTECPRHRHFQPLVRWFSHSSLCPLLGWSAPLSNVQPYVQVYMASWAGTQWVLEAAQTTIGVSRPVVTSITYILTTEAGGGPGADWT